MSRTVSCRIPTQLHEELRERCNLIGESINDFVKAAIEIGLYGTCDFDFGDEQEPELKEIPKGTVTKVIDDNGNVVLDNSKKKPQVVIID